MVSRQQLAKPKRTLRVSIAKMLHMSPEEVSNLPVEAFEYIRANQIAQFPKEYLFALKPEHIRYLRPFDFSLVNKEWLQEWIDRLTELALDEPDEETKPGYVWHKKKMVHQDNVVHYGARRTIELALEKALYNEKLEQRKQRLSHLDLWITKDYFRLEAIAQRLDVTQRFLHLLREEGILEMRKIVGRWGIEKQSMFHYLNQCRKPIAVFNENNKPIKDSTNELGYQAVELPPHNDIPKLYHVQDVSEWAEVDHRVIVRACKAGFFTHYKFGIRGVVKISRESYEQTMNQLGEKPRFS